MTRYSKKAEREGRIVLTFDLDCGELLARGGRQLPSVIRIRLGRGTPASVIENLLQVLGLRTADLEAGVIVIVEGGRHRVRRLPISSH